MHSTEDAATTDTSDVSIPQQIYPVNGESTGAPITAETSVDVLHHYCEQLPVDKCCTPKPIFKISQSGGLYECEVILPANAAIQAIVGPLHSDCAFSKQLACLEACKKLQNMGALDDNYFSSSDVDVKTKLETQNNGSDSGPAGSTKRKELHGIVKICSLSGTWRGKSSGATFHAYRINFSSNIASEIYSSFVLLTESRLDDEVATARVDLYKPEKEMVTSSIIYCGQKSYNADEIARATQFHEIYFNCLFGRLFHGPIGQKEFLLRKHNEQLWCASYMYLILPLESPGTHDPESLNINWEGIHSCLSIIEVMKKSSQLSSDLAGCNHQDFAPVAPIGSRTSAAIDSVYMADHSLPVNELKEAVLIAVHTGRMYSVVDVLTDRSSESPFDGNSDPKTPKYSSFADYYLKKYGIVLSHPHQPLLLLKQSHNAFNLLVDFKKEGEKLSVSKPPNRVHMPPELFVKTNIPVAVLKASYLLPSLMHRLESLMLATQLRQEIGFQSTNGHISSSLILEALTTHRCCETFSMERLELLGDSVLKYAVSCHLFLTYLDEQEGKLSSQRSQAICNATLHKLGTGKNIQCYIRDSAFEPRRWIAPGQLSIHPASCTHDLNTTEVPLDCNRFVTSEENVMLAKNCDKGHRWMCSKTISDCVEALIGAYFVGGGLTAALHFMKWLGMEVDCSPSCLKEAIDRASLHCYTLKSDQIEILEGKLCYKFSVKGLLLEAITHALDLESGVKYCYQRLEFLGDAALDLLITQYLYQAYSNVDQGELTDLRSASVNNESFAAVAVRKNLYSHLQSNSEVLLREIEEYQKLVVENESLATSLLGQKGPKALGDLVESIAGAILIDSNLSLDEVWRVFEPLLSPIVTPETLELAPYRELIELCAYHGYFIRVRCSENVDMVLAELRLQLEDVLLIGEGIDRKKKTAKGQAAIHLLKDLQGRGITHDQCSSKKRKQEFPGNDNLFLLDEAIMGADCKPFGEECAEQSLSKKKSKPMLNQASSGVPKGQSAEFPVTAAVDMQKGGPRKSIYELCKKLLWPRPTFQSTEINSWDEKRSDESSKPKRAPNSYTSTISLHIPNKGVLEILGTPKADKKRSQDSAALLLLQDLEKQGYIRIRVYDNSSLGLIEARV